MADAIRLSQQYAEVVESGANDAARLSQQYAEVVDSGSGDAIRLSQQYAEVADSGTANQVRLSQQYLEVISNPYVVLSAAGKIAAMGRVVSVALLHILYVVAEVAAKARGNPTLTASRQLPLFVPAPPQSLVSSQIWKGRGIRP